MLSSRPAPTMQPPMAAPKNECIQPTVSQPQHHYHQHQPQQHRKSQLSQKEVLAENQPFPATFATITDERHASNQLSADATADLKLRRLRSDISERRTRIRHSVDDSQLSRVQSQQRCSLGDVPTNVIVNAFENVPAVGQSAILPLSETEPLLTNIESTVTDPLRSICLQKNSASLVFTKKDLPSDISVQRRGSNRERVRTNKTAEPTRFQHRRSLQLNYPSFGGSQQNGNSATSANRKQHAYSWYAPVYSALEEELEQDSRDSSPIHNLATKRKTSAHQAQSDNETESLLETKNQINIQPQLHQPTRTRRPTQPPNTLSLAPTPAATQLPPLQNDTEGPHATSLLAGGPVPRRRRFENFLKNLVGRKPSKDPATNPPLLPSPDITITRTPSDNNVLQDPHGYDKVAAISTTSLNAMQQKLWNVVPLLRREGSASSLYQEKSQSIVQYTGLRKCETVLALSHHQSHPQSSLSPDPLSPSTGSVEQIRPLNRLRNSLSTSNATCSRCSSLLSLAASGSRYSLNLANSGFVNVNSNSLSGSASAIVYPSSDCQSRKSSAGAKSGDGPSMSNDTTATLHSGSGSAATTTTASSSSTTSSTSSSVSYPLTAALTTTTTTTNQLDAFTCKLCLAEITANEATKISHCGCSFCTECMKAYVEFEISEGAYEISCPDAQCPSQGSMSLTEINNLTSNNLMKKFHRYRLNREIELDKYRTWCPRAGCETICQVGSSFATTSSSADDKENAITQILCAVQCPTCKEEFCSGCKKPWHPNISCDENNRRLAAEGQDDIGIPFDNDLIKCCPMCAVPIEKDEGCAQMMCKRCKHVFCWYCLASLDDDFLLRHYDKGPCKNKLGHSRASVVWHRAQVIGIFAGFGILLLVASPLLLLAAPCIICCKCRICSGSKKNEEGEGGEFDESAALQR